MLHYILWATGRDHPGFVSKITKVLFENGCNLEDSSMMRLGSEFAMMVILSSKKTIVEKTFAVLKKSSDINIGLKQISSRLAKFTPQKENLVVIRIHGQDRPGLVFHVTQCLAKNAFNITDLSSHRTTVGKTPGYILIVEGEPLKRGGVKVLKRSLGKLGRRLGVQLSMEEKNLVPAF